ncbi:hypothetical protein [Streptomyces sp. NBC_01508]|uniref:hypothetical protein n=2 Tax=unclassified Streptomyces TaxID=2593676 RepID=UPI00386937E0
MATVDMSVLPSVSARARPVPLCPAVVGVCAWTEAAYEGELRILFDEEQLVRPAARSVSNQDVQPWCFYERQVFDTQSKMREVGSGKAVSDLGFDDRSAQQGACQREG